MRFFPTSVDYFGVASIPAPSSVDLAECVLLVEQIDAERFPHLDDLPAACGLVRFPSLDSNLFWPFGAVNPYDESILPDFPNGRFPYGNRVLQRCIEADWDAERVVTYYLDEYDDFRVDLRRVADLERVRLRAREEKSDVAMCDALADLVSTRLFWSNNHPRAELLRILAARVAVACATYVPELAGLDFADGFERYERNVEWTGVPIHPGVAAELGLAWYDRDDRYLQEGGSRLTHDEYVREFVGWAIVNREKQRRQGTATVRDVRGWRLPLDGPARIAGPVLGIYPDAFAAPLLRFELEALEDLETFTVEAFYPSEHRRAAAMVCSLGASKTEAMIEPGTAFSLTLRSHLAKRERARFALACSETLNMLERGESEDDRDLGVLILKMTAVRRGSATGR